VNVTGGAGAVVVVALFADGAAGIVATCGLAAVDVVVGAVVAGGALVAAVFAAGPEVDDEEGDTGFGIALKGTTGLNNEKLCSWPTLVAATVVEPGVVAPGVVEVVVAGGGAEELEPPLIIFRSFGPWSNATARKTTPSPTAAMRARRSRICACVGRREGAISDSLWSLWWSWSNRSSRCPSSSTRSPGRCR
jgi:hypothetical protein